MRTGNAIIVKVLVRKQQLRIVMDHYVETEVIYTLNRRTQT